MVTHRVTIMTMYKFLFFFNDTATTEIYTLSLHDALPICDRQRHRVAVEPRRPHRLAVAGQRLRDEREERAPERSEEHTSELQSRQYLVCRLLLEKKKKEHPNNSCQHHPLPTHRCLSTAIH